MTTYLYNAGVLKQRPDLIYVKHKCIDTDQISAPRSRSTTPQETDLLRYLTAHMKQLHVSPGGSCV
jgi:hypothetical protein